ncbi:MAG: hypothetical protein VB878_17115 [Pirellulaceae bacterium]
MLIQRIVNTLVVVGVVFMAISATAALAFERPFGLDSRADLDPYLPIDDLKYEYAADLIPVWKLALEHDEPELQRRTAEVVFAVARQGMKGLEVLTPSLRKLMEGPIVDRKVHLAALRALTAIGDKQSASRLYDLSGQLGCDAAEVLEPALAQWKYEAIYPAWRARLEDESLERRHRVFAIRGLTVVRDEQSAAAVIRLATNSATSSVLRIEAARAAAQLQTSGSETVVEEMLKDEPSLVDRLAAATLLLLHDGDRTTDILLRLALDASPVVQRIAIEELQKIAPGQLLTLQSQLFDSHDAKIRELAVLCLHPYPTSEHAAILSPMLNDHHPEVRNAARRTLVSFFASSDEMRVAVIKAAVEQLNGDSWRGLQQAARLVGQIDHEPSASRCVELLVFDRREVHTTAAWALRKLQVEESLATAFEYASNRTQEIRSERVDSQLYTEQLSQLFQLFGILRYQESVPLLRLYVPKNSATEDSRVGAIWALGYIYQDAAPNDLVRELTGRLNDTNPMSPEIDSVRAASAVSLGRMKAQTSLPSLRKYYDLESTIYPVGYACGWAIEQLTGEAIVITHLPPQQRQSFFLTTYRD